ncbi:MFS general substrate transporter [Venustampulla echinocandica]|uniref:MFS general substrate transporter n=1 Tax=Venustampulla echinocandica TaxID=2656787 RepID=A0A370U1K3_9HELO|nr:MFS general substrate transporter [Venustampulla echinocandica]RDL41623.1 MFS general substrate transporter [Venustampulla echinocandica]
MAIDATLSEKLGEKAGESTISDHPENGSIGKGHLGHIKGQDEAGKYAHTTAMNIDGATNKRIRNKIDRHLLPWMCGLYLLQYLDKTTLSYAAAMNIKEDMGMNDAEYSWAGSIFYVGYLVFEYPHNRLFQILPIARYLGCVVMIWGVILALHSVCFNAAGILTVRFFLGAFEGAVTAGFVLITSQWYRTSEQTFRTAVWFTCNGLGQITGGALAYGVARGFRENTSIHFSAWKALFILTGGVSSVYGLFMFFFVADSPVTAKWLTEEEKVIAVERLRGNQQGIGTKVFKWYQVREAFTDIRTYLIFLFTVTSNIPNGGITVFFTQLIQGLGFDAETTFLLSMPGGGVQLIANLGIPFVASKLGHRYLGAVFALVVGLFGISLMTGLAMHDPLNATAGQLFGYYIVIGNSATALILILGTISSNTAGHTKKTTVNAISLIGYCIGFLIGPQTFQDGPYYYNAKYNIIVQWFLAGLCCLALHFVNKKANKKRDELFMADGSPPQPAGQEFLDLTDKENRYFRYAL